MSDTFRDRNKYLYKEHEMPEWWGWRMCVPSEFKRENRREERNIQNRALREGKEIPIFKRHDEWDYW
jgi:hypothetical protein